MELGRLVAGIINGLVKMAPHTWCCFFLGEELPSLAATFYLLHYRVVKRKIPARSHF